MPGAVYSQSFLGSLPYASPSIGAPAVHTSGYAGSFPSGFGDTFGFGSSAEDLPRGLGYSSSLGKNNQDAGSAADSSEFVCRL